MPEYLWHGPEEMSTYRAPHDQGILKITFLFTNPVRKTIWTKAKGHFSNLLLEGDRPVFGHPFPFMTSR